VQVALGEVQVGFGFDAATVLILECVCSGLLVPSVGVLRVDKSHLVTRLSTASACYIYTQTQKTKAVIVMVITFTAASLINNHNLRLKHWIASAHRFLK
jgi:hypothetical protein